eukprot:TRINITY_DN32247_c0_g1_i2.p1 TRINITY_DN32247_c0_g1~~TRINITY_DN32247_c0_g1_i2.p1  ORF type:complete len:243 (-),score=24.02 TRINITY_DN32247_c0_g1_i2:476-1204(-)
MLRPRFAIRLATELRSFRRWSHAHGLPAVAAANKDEYLTALDELGGEVFLGADFVRRFVRPLVQRFLPEAMEDGELTRTYAFARHYYATPSAELLLSGDGIHHDESTVTLNVALSRVGAFVGGNLSFCGVFGLEDYRKHVLTLDWTQSRPGRAVLHHGLRRHAAAPVISGERMNLIVWASSFTPGGISSGDWETKWTPDAECLSELYDSDYKTHRDKLCRSAQASGSSLVWPLPRACRATVK